MLHHAALPADARPNRHTSGFSLGIIAFCVMVARSRCRRRRARLKGIFRWAPLCRNSPCAEQRPDDDDQFTVFSGLMRDLAALTRRSSTIDYVIVPESSRTYYCRDLLNNRRTRAAIALLLR